MELNNMGGMRPTKGCRTLTLPVTFDYSGGRSEKRKSRILLSVILMVLATIAMVGIVFNKEGNFIVNIIFGVGIFVVTLYVVRYPIMGEKTLRRGYDRIDESDMRESFKKIWGIYDISDEYPYICRFRSGKSAIFVQLNKDVILGKYSDSEFSHYEAIGDAYNLSGSGSIQICHIDYMSNVGFDESIENSFAQLADVENPDLKDILTDIFSYQQLQMMERVTTYDVYAFYWKGSDSLAWNSIRDILSCFMDANYVSYKVLDVNSLRLLPMYLFNLHEFSVIRAKQSAFEVSTKSTITPISISRSDGSYEKLNLTSDEQKEKMVQEEKERQIKKGEIKRRKNSKHKKGGPHKGSPYEEDDVIDFFDK